MMITKTPTHEIVTAPPSEWKTWVSELFSPNERAIEISAYGNLVRPKTRWRGLALLAGAAPTSFELDGQRYASVDSFHYSLKFPEGKERLACAQAAAMEAREMAKKLRADSFQHEGATITVGSADHRALFARAVVAKVSEHREVQKVLRSTCWSQLQFPRSEREWQGQDPGVPGLVTPVVYMIERAKRWGPPASV